MKRKLLFYAFMLILTVMLLSAVTVTASAASAPTTIYVEPSEENGIPSQINVFEHKVQTGGSSWNPTYTTYHELYLPGSAATENCFLSWDGGATATVDGEQYGSGECPVPSIPSAGESGENTYTFKDGNTTLATYTITAFQGSENVTPVFIEIDESQGTIEAMDSNKENICTGTIYIDGTQYVLDKMKGRGNATWDNAVDKKPYNITLGSKIKFPGVDSEKTKKWSFLAEVLDRSLLCNRSGYHLAHELGIGQDTASADVWMQGEYQGCYTVTPKTDSFVTKTGFMIEQDNYKEPAVASGGDPQFSLEGLNSHVESSTWTSSYNLITVKKMGDDLLGYDENGEADESAENMTAKADDIREWLQKAWDAMKSSDGYNSEGKHYTDYIDIESFAKMYLMHEYVKSYDVCAGSILFHRNGQTDDDKLIAGPLWDLDNAMGSTYSNSYLGDVSDRRSAQGSFIENISNYRNYGEEYKTSIYKTLGKHADFMEEVYLQYNKNKAAFDSLKDDTEDMISEIGVSAAMNHAKVTDIGNGTGKNNHYYSSDQALGTNPYTQSYSKTSSWGDYAGNLKTYITVRSAWFNDTYYDPDYHEHDYEITVTKDPSCTETGLATYTCTICGDTLEDQEVPALGHDFDDDSGICTRCDYAAPRATIICNTGASVTVYRTKAYDVAQANTAFANPRNGDTGEIDISGDGQINFKVNIAQGYALESVTAEPGTAYNKLKNDPDSSGDVDSYRLTKVKGDLVLTVTAVCTHDYQTEVTLPTCTEQGYTTYTCSRCGDTYVDDYVDALGHDYTFEYDWADNGSSCTATATCSRDASHTVTEEAEITSTVKTPATCEEKGTTTYTATFTNDLFETKTKDVSDIPALEHDYSFEYDWADDGSSCTATATCSRDETHVVTEEAEIKSAVKTPATCEEKGVTTYTATFKNDLFETKTKDVEDIDPLGHDYAIEYDWAEDGSSCAATAVCSRSASHTVTEEAEIESSVKTPATCEGKGVTRYTATFTNDLFETKTKDVADIPALEHDYSFEYEWADDGSSCTATATCSRDETHVVTEEAEIKSAVKTPATCEEKGTTRYTASFTNDLFETKTKDVEDIDPLGHDYAIEYDWADDGKACTATATCSRSASHTVTENAEIESAVKTPATCEEKGVTTYTASFTNDLFETKTKDVADISALGHDYTIGYEWAEDGSSCTATAVCSRNASHTVTENAEIKSAVKTPATCEEKGTTTYTATFTNDLFETKTKDVEDIDPLGHDYAIEYDWAEDGSACTATAVCSRDASHTVTENAEITSAVKTQATCEDDGVTTYTASFTNGLFGTKTKDVTDTPALGHSYLDSPWKAVDDDEHQRACSRRCGHVEKAPHEYDEGEVTKPATFDEEGVMTYTCGICGHEKTETIDRLDPKDKMGEDGTALGPGASYEAADAAITGMKSDGDPAGSRISPLVLCSSRQTTGSVKVTWKGPSDAVKYVIYGNRCGKSYRMKKIKELGGDKRSVTLKKIVKKIKKGTCYKLILVALDSNNDVVSASKVVHVFTKGGKSCNYKSVTTKAKKNRVTLKVGKTFSLKAKGVKQSSKLKVASHKKIRYQSTDSAIAAVTSKGTIRAKAKGTCYVYAYAQNGVYKKIKVTVK